MGVGPRQKCNVGVEEGLVTLETFLGMDGDADISAQCLESLVFSELRGSAVRVRRVSVWVVSHERKVQRTP